MKNSILLMIALTCFAFLGAAQAEETVQQQTPEERTFALFQQFMQAKDWQLAEVIARGAMDKFGRQHEVVQQMRTQLVTLCEGNLNVTHRFDFLPQPPMPPKYDYKISNRIYSVADLLTPVNNSYSDPLKELAAELIELRGDIAKDAIAACPFDTNISIVVSTTKEHHERIAKFLESKRAAK